MNEMILIKLGEMVLKGLNRRSFEDKLQANINRKIHKFGQFKVYTRQSTTYVEPKSDDCDVIAAYEAVQKVFGIVGVSLARSCEKDKDIILETCKEYLGDKLSTAKTFKVETKRADKKFPMTSIQLSQYVGGELHEFYDNLEVDVHHPELTVHVEIRDFAAYVHANPVAGAGGMPVGSNGRAVTLLSGGIDSPVSTYMIAKRGVKLIPVHFFSFPYTSEAAKEKVIELGSILTDYCGSMQLELVPFTHIQEEIREKCPEEYFTLIMRRFMMRIATIIAERNGCVGIVTGENLGQVASQTMEAMASTQAVTNLPVLQPLVGMDKEDIIKLARKLDTFDTSILPYEDCCTVFTPKHPKTKPKVADVEELESVLDIEGLVMEAVDSIERVRLG